ncbi:GGDEF-domain containing protein [Acetobacter orientalis]|uniref:GGDEF-domain containing protein n=1 Tax=Acetobacter orientalis TaxID=146474 RepID=A0A2Z5ZGR6_9PROT|nr:GGDEF-domain containing protein [Acetobacter orientalis]
MPQQWFCLLLEKPLVPGRGLWRLNARFYPDTSTSWRYRWGHYKTLPDIKMHAPVYGVGECWQFVRLGMLWLAISQI